MMLTPPMRTICGAESANFAGSLYPPWPTWYNFRMIHDDKLLMQEIEQIKRAIGMLRAPAMPGEYDLHALINEALTHAGIEHAHEYRLAPRCRIDFKAGRIGIEVKKGKPDARTLAAQITRYLASEELSALVVVMQRAVFVPERIGGKPVIVVSLNRLWGVALP